jgi:hypothetical protein
MRRLFISTVSKVSRPELSFTLGPAQETSPLPIAVPTMRADLASRPAGHLRIHKGYMGVLELLEILHTNIKSILLIHHDISYHIPVMIIIIIVKPPNMYTA